ncbi:hypothetical protein AVEN_244455-1 [Araneus ventricosus]|uniref:Uncharacterized protein n=1 Tax=Araneus ventricosus TaxID=182803 RepID=A0A4Y2N1B0_ARAVE|nr:hypothetical protein AVEN_244455-1 [Araneus ventricosus]
MDHHLLRYPLKRESVIPSARLYISRISTFIARQSKRSGWISRLDGNPNFGPYRPYYRRYSALTAGFGMQRPNLRIEESSWKSRIRLPLDRKSVFRIPSVYEHVNSEKQRVRWVEFGKCV